MVTPAHVRLMQAVAEADERYGAPDLRLEGGTALAAYHLGHRVSKDLDFFASFGLNAIAFGDVVQTTAEERGFQVHPTRARSRGFAQFIATDAESGASIQVDIAASSPFHLDARDHAEEGIRVASYRDLCAGKLHAICDRYEVRDFVDLHAILTRPMEGGAAPDEAEVRSRFRGLVADLIESDPGLDAMLVGAALMRGRGKPIIARLPLLLFGPMDDDAVQRTIGICVDECSALASSRLDRPLD